jgi:hypothetical protein
VSAPVETPVDRLYHEASAILEQLGADAEVSLQIAAADNLRKALLLAAASYFEHRLCQLVMEFIKEKASGCTLIEQFVRNKAIARQYHTWFKWDDTNANQFFGLFGSEFRAAMADRVKASDELRLSIRAFLDIGNERNRLVHQDYATFPLEKTMDEIYSSYKKAQLFLDSLPLALRDYDSS